ncbi:hypothetical protein [Mesorhizobium sp. M1163]|uniref:hypothetical protein n=1 Tax=Mesorhizobium sp. M1163 TaxID=2957065 RepID=UPI0033358924
MTSPVLVDNDVIIKMSCYTLGDELVDCLSIKETPPAILKVASFVVRGRIKKSRSLVNREVAGRHLEALLPRLMTVEPTTAEVDLAATYEAKAQELNLELDSGESQLLAILMVRGLELMLTGDKRAIHAVERIAGADLERPRVACLEQAIATIVQQTDFADIRARICREPAADRAISICFSCASQVSSVSSIVEGLRSYIKLVRAQAPRVLLPANDLSGVIA